MEGKKKKKKKRRREREACRSNLTKHDREKFTASE